MTEDQRREWEEARRIARREAGVPPVGAESRPGCVGLAMLGFFAGGSLGMWGTLPFLFALHYFFGVRIDPQTPPTLGILGAAIGMIVTPIVCGRPPDEW